MSTDAAFVRKYDDARQTAQAAAVVGDVWQLPDGRAAVVVGNALASGDRGQWTASGQWVIPKTAGICLLDGGRVFWDRSAGAGTFRRNADRDFLLGVAVGDAASADTTCTVNLNVDPPYDRELSRDPLYAVAVGTQALGGFLPTQRRGGALKFLLSSTNEAQKTDALGKDGFDAAARAVVEFAVEVVSLGSGSAPDFNVGIASGTHATDADGIAQHLFAHVDGNSGAIKFQSKDGTHTTAATDSTKTLTAGTRFEVWMDLRSPAAAALYVDGVRVLSGTTFDVSAAAGPLYLLAHLEKTAAADTFEVDVDWLEARFAEQR